MRRRSLLKDSGVDWSKEYLTFTALESGTFKFSGTGMNYSIDGGNTWTTLASDTNSPTVESRHTIMWKASLTSSSYEGIGTFSSSGRFNVEGNPMSLRYGDNFIGQTSLSGTTSQFYNLFYNCTKVINAVNLSLPATTLADYCYQRMFYGCTSLTTAPELPATTLASYCYNYMFNGCTSLTTAPSVLPATTLASYCYYCMFNGCTSLTTAPALPATTLADRCYGFMFYNCTSLTTAPSVLPATTMAIYCYENMFYGCTSLTTAPALPATKLANYCYNYMFYNCSNLNYIKAMFTTKPSSSYTSYWVYGVASSGTFVKNSAATWNVRGTYGVPSGWTIQTASE